MSRVIGDSRGSCRKRGLPSSISSVVSSASPLQPKPTGSRASILHRLLKRYREGGLEAVDAPIEATSQQPPCGQADEVIIAIVGLREQLTADGLDAGPLTLQWHLKRRPVGARDIHDPAHPAPPRPDHPPATQTTEKLLPPLRSRPNPTNAGNPTSPTGH